MYLIRQDWFMNYISQNILNVQCIMNLDIFGVQEDYLISAIKLKINFKCVSILKTRLIGLIYCKSELESSKASFNPQQT